MPSRLPLPVTLLLAAALCLAPAAHWPGARWPNAGGPRAGAAWAQQADTPPASEAPQAAAPGAPLVSPQTAPPAASPRPAQGPQRAAGQAARFPVQRLSFYPDAVGRPIEQKVTVGGPEVLDRALETNLDYGQAIRPRNADADDPLLPELRALLRDLPPAVHRLASRYVLAVYVLQDDYGTGTTEGIQDDQGRWRYSYIALNRTALTRTANAWATWKENSAFRPQPGAALRVQIEPPESDTRAQAVQFILLHELGHAIGLGLGVHGFWDAETLPAVTRDSPFVALSWQVDADDALVSRYATRFPLLVRARFYRFDKAPLELSQAQDIYRDLSQTNLPSLYGITNLFDDWAESFAIYVHTRLLDKPYQVQVLQGDQVRATYQSCLQVGTCPEKMAYLESVLGTGQ